jgi:hypothetical protein
VRPASAASSFRTLAFRVADQRGSPTTLLCRFARMTRVASTGQTSRPTARISASALLLRTTPILIR